MKKISLAICTLLTIIPAVWLLIPYVDSAAHLIKLHCAGELITPKGIINALLPYVGVIFVCLTAIVWSIYSLVLSLKEKPFKPSAIYDMAMKNLNAKREKTKQRKIEKMKSKIRKIEGDD